VERWFCDGKECAEALDNLRKFNKDNYCHVLGICRAHSQLRSIAGIVITLDCITESLRIDRDSIEYSQVPKRMSVFVISVVWVVATAISIQSYTVTHDGLLQQNG
jgi:hypothetical protein